MFSAIILGGGSGERMGLGYNKVLYKFKGVTVIEYAAKKFIEDHDFTEVLIVMNRDDYDQAKLLFNNPKVRVIKGGNTRQESVYIGLSELKESKYVMIHDGARPNPSLESIKKLKESVVYGPVILYTASKDSLIYKNNILIDSYIDRDKVGMVKTPQAFSYVHIMNAYEQAKLNHTHYKDDASLLMSELALQVALIEDDETNIKLTTKFDIKIMEELL